MNLINPPRVLLFSPTSVHKLYCQKEWIELLKNLTYPNLQFLIIDNSDNQLNSIRIKSIVSGNNRFMILWKKFDSVTTIRERIARCQEVMRKYALNLKYDFAFSLESDVFPPLNIIEWLVSFNKPLIGCSYFHSFGEGEGVTMLLHEIATYNDGSQELHRLSFRQQCEFMDGTIKPAVQPGIGCMLIRADVLAKTQFRLITDIPEYQHLSIPTEGFPSDYVFYEELRHKFNLFPLIDTSIIPEHFNSADRWKKIQNAGMGHDV